MTRLTILHETRYSYERPVGFGTHRLLLRPRDSHAIRVIEALLTMSSPGEVRWVFDPLGNCVCLFTPEGQADHLLITNRLVIDRFPAPLAFPKSDALPQHGQQPDRRCLEKVFPDRKPKPRPGH